MARKDITMTNEEIHDFLRNGRTLEVASIGVDGYPHVAPMWYVVEDDRVKFRSFRKSQKIVNLRRNPKVTVLVETGDTYAELRGVMIQGEARLIDDPADVLHVYGLVARKHGMMGSGDDLSPEELEAAFGAYAAKNTAVVVEPHKIISWDHRKLGGAY